MIDVQQGTYSRWENGTLEPSLEAVVKLAKLFDTTTDYLLENDLQYSRCPTSNHHSELI